MFGDYLMLSLKLVILFSKTYSIHLHYAIHFTKIQCCQRLIEERLIEEYFWFIQQRNWSAFHGSCHYSHCHNQQ